MWSSGFGGVKVQRFRAQDFRSFGLSNSRYIKEGVTRIITSPNTRHSDCGVYNIGIIQYEGRGGVLTMEEGIMKRI